MSTSKPRFILIFILVLVAGFSTETGLAHQRAKRVNAASERALATTTSIRLALATNALRGLEANNVDRTKALLHQAFDSDLQTLSHADNVQQMGQDEQSILEQAIAFQAGLAKPVQ